KRVSPHKLFSARIRSCAVIRACSPKDVVASRGVALFPPLQRLAMVSTMTGNDDEGHCITESRTAHGYYWRYTHAKDEDDETLLMAIRIAGDVAADEARKSGKTYVVASTPQPSPAVYVLAADHPELSSLAMHVMYAMTPEGECIRHRKPTRH